MKYEPKKVIRGIDLTCFYQTFIPEDKEQSFSAYYISGTSEAYLKLIPFFENQIEMVQKFGSATKSIILKKPHEFKQPIHVGDLQFNNKKLVLNYLSELKVKILSTEVEPQIQLIEKSQLIITSTLVDLNEALKTCHMRQHNQTHGAHFLGFDSTCISSTPIGDWHGIE